MKIPIILIITLLGVVLLSGCLGSSEGGAQFTIEEAAADEQLTAEEAAEVENLLIDETDEVDIGEMI